MCAPRSPGLGVSACVRVCVCVIELCAPHLGSRFHFWPAWIIIRPISLVAGGDFVLRFARCTGMLPLHCEHFALRCRQAGCRVPGTAHSQFMLSQRYSTRPCGRVQVCFLREHAPVGGRRNKRTLRMAVSPQLPRPRRSRRAMRTRARRGRTCPRLITSSTSSGHAQSGACRQYWNDNGACRTHAPSFCGARAFGHPSLCASTMGSPKQIRSVRSGVTQNVDCPDSGSGSEVDDHWRLRDHCGSGEARTELVPAWGRTAETRKLCDPPPAPPLFGVLDIGVLWRQLAEASVRDSLAADTAIACSANDRCCRLGVRERLVAMSAGASAASAP